ncbi:MAG: hypothetical protein DHS20C14_11930 [Phycisphaeraceae bacterium]|nr:MAG: hypothetical protein DHS20C14_11930 [Phycisphaeraceae bacterium]
MSRRGYILVIVVLLTLVVGLMTAVGMNRQSAQSRAVARQTAAYRDHHATRGIQEAIGVWLSTVNARDIGESLGPEGHALDITLDDGTTLRIHLHDGQGTALADLGTVVAADVDRAGAVLVNLHQLVGEDAFESFTRPGGAVQVSINSAPEPVLRAVLLATVPEGMTDDIAGILIDQRRGGTVLTRNDVIQAGTAAGATNEERGALSNALTDQPELWWVTVVARHPIRGVTARYGGLVLLRTARTRGSSAGTSSFVTWMDLGVGRHRVLPPPGVPEIE